MGMSLLKRLFDKDKSSQEEKARAALPPSDQEDTKHNSQIVVGIPGPWESEQDLMKSLLEDNEGELILLGLMLFDPHAQEHCWVDMRGFNPRMRKAFEVAGGGRIPNETLNLIGQHKHCAYLILDDPSTERAKTAIRFTNAFLRAGGIAINVESAGVAHDRQTWIEKATRLADYDLYSLFVQLVGSGGQYYSCGMQNFGLPDAEVSSLDKEEAAHILNEFNFYRLTENPELVDGDVVMLPPALRFKLRWHEYEGYDPETPLYNSWGKWLLEPLPAIIFVQTDDPLMTEALAEARSTVEQFIHALQNPKPSQPHFSVKIPISEGDDVRHIWLDSVQFQDGKFTGIVGNEPGTMTAISVGDRVSAAPEEISDWMYVEDGKLIGGFTLRVIRDGMSERERFEFDRCMPFAIE
jgi:uncharacterized protein YegJ (DUF2314 family)